MVVGKSYLMSWEFLEFVLYRLDSVCRYRVNCDSSFFIHIVRKGMQFGGLASSGFPAWNLQRMGGSVCCSPLNLLKDCHIIGRQNISN